MSKPGGAIPPGSVREKPEACPSGIRHGGGAKLILALARNVRTWPAMPKEKAQAAPIARPKVPMRGRAGWRNAKHAGEWEATLATYAYPHVGSLSVQAVDTALGMKVLEQSVQKDSTLWTARPETASR